MRAGAYIHCALPYEEGRYIEKVSIDLSGHFIELRECSYWNFGIGNGSSATNAPKTVKQATTEYGLTDVGVLNPGITHAFHCLTHNSPNSSTDGYTRFWTATVQYADQ